MNTKQITRIISIILYITLIIVVLFILDLSSAASETWMDANVKNAGLKGVVCYISLITLLIALGVPRQVCSLMGGYVFGLWQGTVFATIGTAFACIFCFSYARFVGQAWLHKKYGHNLHFFNDFLCQSPFLLSLIVRIVPLGSNFLTNFLAGISRIPAKYFLSGSIVGFTVQNFIFAMLGSGLHVEKNVQTFISIALYLISLMLGYWVFLRYKKHKQEFDISYKQN